MAVVVTVVVAMAVAARAAAATAAAATAATAVAVTAAAVTAVAVRVVAETTAGGKGALVGGWVDLGVEDMSTYACSNHADIPGTTKHRWSRNGSRTRCRSRNHR